MISDKKGMLPKQHQEHLPEERMSRCILLAGFPAVVAFLLIPCSMYVTNQKEFNYSISVLVPYLLMLLLFFALVAVSCAIAPKLMRRVSVMFFYLGAVLMASDIVAPLKVGEVMVGWDAPPVPEPSRLSIYEVAAASTILILACMIPRRLVFRFMPNVIFLIVVVQVLFFVKDYKRPAHAGAGQVAQNYYPAERAKKNNIYHITFDSFSADGFFDLLKNSHAENNFSGFVFFPKNKSNYLFTHISRASYMTGRIYREGERLEHFMAEWKTRGLFGGLADAGYEITEYYPSGSNRIAHPRWKSFDISTDLKMIEQVHFADLWMLRLVPTFLNQETFVVHKERGVKRGIISLLLEKWFPLSDLDYLPVRYKKTMEELIKDERQRPRYGQYVWAHLYLPHGPYNLNRNCEYQLNAGYTEQALCSIKLMDDFISELKREGKYDSAMIIFHADHGSVAVKDHDMTGEIMQKINETSESGRCALEVIDLSSSLLFMKPPDASQKPAIISPKLTQLADLPASIYELAGIKADAIDGVNIFGDTFPQDRTIRIFAGFVKRDREQGTLTFGKSIFDGYFDHYGYNASSGWRVEDKIHVQW